MRHMRATQAPTIPSDTTGIDLRELLLQKLEEIHKRLGASGSAQEPSPLPDPSGAGRRKLISDDEFPIGMRPSRGAPIVIDVAAF